MHPLHDRTPVILPADAWDLWLDLSVTDRRRSQSLLQPAADDILEAFRVSPLVNDVRQWLTTRSPGGVVARGLLLVSSSPPVTRTMNGRILACTPTHPGRLGKNFPSFRTLRSWDCLTTVAADNLDQASRFAL